MSAIPDSHRDLAEGESLAILTTIGADGFPQSTPRVPSPP